MTATRRLAVLGANGRTGIEVVRAAREAGFEVVPVVRDDRDQHHLAAQGLAAGTRFADLEQVGAVRAALEDVQVAIAALQPREIGFGAPRVRPEAGPAILDAVRMAGLDKLLWVTTIGAWHWSDHLPSREGWAMEVELRRRPGPWAMVKLGGYHDEILDAYVAPAGGLRPRPVPRKGHWAPLSRRDAGALLVAALDRIPHGRAPCAGGPELFVASEMVRVVAARARSGTGSRTTHPGLPTGDHAVLPEDTLTTAGRMPLDRLEPWLDAALRGEGAVAAGDLAVYPRGGPPPGRLDGGGTSPVTDPWGPDLRRVVHTQLEADLQRRQVPAARLDFSQATPQGRACGVHGGTFTALSGVRVLDDGGNLVLQGEVDFLRDEMAEEFRVFFGTSVPAWIWQELDLGVRRRHGSAASGAGGPVPT